MMKLLTNFWPGKVPSLDVRCFDGRTHDDTPYDARQAFSVETILQALPAGWVPDAVVFKSPQYQPLPEGFERFPFPTVVLLDDWFGSIDYLTDSLAAADYLFTDRLTLSLLSKLGFDNAAYWPCFGFNPDRFRLLEGESRTCDVAFAGSLNINIQGRRLPWLRKLCSIDRKYSVGLFYNVLGEEYVRMLNRTRIGFNYSIKGEMNLRAFEVPACGALLFIEEDNREVRDFLEPGRECVTYNEGNFEDLLRRYLEDEPLRAAVAAAGHAKIQSFTYARLFERLAGSIAGLGLTAGCGRSRRRRYSASAGHCHLVQNNLSLRGRTADTPDRIGGLLGECPADPLVFNDCAVVLAAFLEDRRKVMPAQTQQLFLKNCIDLLVRARTVLPGYFTARFNQAQVCAQFGMKQEAALIYEELLESTGSADEARYRGIVYPLHYFTPLRTEWVAAFTRSVPLPAAIARERHRVIRFFSALSLGAIASQRGDHDAALGHYTLANRIFAGHPAVTTPLSLCAAFDPSLPENETILADALRDNPFNVSLWKRRIRVLRGQPGAAAAFIDECTECMERAQFATSAIIGEFAAMKDVITGHGGSPLTS